MSAEFEPLEEGILLQLPNQKYLCQTRGKNYGLILDVGRMNPGLGKYRFVRSINRQLYRSFMAHLCRTMDAMKDGFRKPCFMKRIFLVFMAHLCRLMGVMKDGFRKPTFMNSINFFFFP